MTAAPDGPAPDGPGAERPDAATTDAVRYLRPVPPEGWGPDGPPDDLAAPETGANRGEPPGDAAGAEAPMPDGTAPAVGSPPTKSAAGARWRMTAIAAVALLVVLGAGLVAAVVTRPATDAVPPADPATHPGASEAAGRSTPTGHQTVVGDGQTGPESVSTAPGESVPDTGLSIPGVAGGGGATQPGGQIGPGPSVPGQRPVESVSTPPFTTAPPPTVRVAWGNVQSCNTNGEECTPAPIYESVPPSNYNYLTVRKVARADNGRSLPATCWATGGITYNWSALSDPPVTGRNDYQSAVYFKVTVDGVVGWIADTYFVRDGVHRLGLPPC
jgi:hypothetical protein